MALLYSWVMLVTSPIEPLGMKCTAPLASRNCVTRSVKFSTVPEVPFRDTTSPMASWPSISMKKPEMRSLTRLCEPNEIAKPSRPRPVNTAVVLTPNSPSSITSRTPPSTKRSDLRNTATSVRARCTTSGSAVRPRRSCSARRTIALEASPISHRPTNHATMRSATASACERAQWTGFGHAKKEVSARISASMPSMRAWICRAVSCS
jgi:hypothetical protein